MLYSPYQVAMTNFAKNFRSQVNPQEWNKYQTDLASAQKQADQMGDANGIRKGMSSEQINAALNKPQAVLQNFFAGQVQKQLAANPGTVYTGLPNSDGSLVSKPSFGMPGYNPGQYSSSLSLDTNEPEWFSDFMSSNSSKNDPFNNSVRKKPLG